MKKINLYKPGGKDEEEIPKTIQEVGRELEERLKNQELEPDSYFLSKTFKDMKKNAFPAERKLSGTLAIGEGKLWAFISLNSEEGEESQLKGRLYTAQYNIEKGNMSETYEKATEALKIMLGSFYMNMDMEKNINIQRNIEKTQEAQEINRKLLNMTEKEREKLRESNIDKAIEKETRVISTDNKSPQEIAKSIQQALSDPNVAEEYKKLQEQATDKKSTTQAANIETAKTQTIKIQTENRPLVDEKIVEHSNKKASKESTQTAKVANTAETVSILNTANTENSDLKNQLINVNFTPAQAEVVINLLEENQKKYEPKSSMFRLLGDTLGKMLQALNKKLDQIIDSEKIISNKLESIYSAINDENYELFKEKYAGLEQKIKYCHDILSEAAQGKSIQSTSIIDHILNKEKVPVSIRTLQKAFVTAIDNNIESALAIYKYSDENLHGEAHFNTIRGFLSHALNTLPDNEAEKFINISSIRAFDDTVIFKEMIRAEKYNLLNSSLQQCKNIDEHAPSLYYFAAQRKDADALHLLASMGANINENNGEALYTCFETNKLETAKILINFGADAKTLLNRVETIQKFNPKYTLPDESIGFLNEIYKHAGFDGYTTTSQQNITEEYAEDEVHGEDGDLDANY